MTANCVRRRVLLLALQTVAGHFVLARNSADFAALMSTCLQMCSVHMCTSVQFQLLLLLLSSSAAAAAASTNFSILTFGWEYSHILGCSNQQDLAWWSYL